MTDTLPGPKSPRDALKLPARARAINLSRPSGIATPFGIVTIWRHVARYGEWLEKERI
jgi:hypothetical protein